MGETGRVESSECPTWLDVGDNEDSDSKLTSRVKAYMRGKLGHLLIEIGK